MDDDATERFAGWAVLELMGHRKLAGYVTEVELAGHGMLRLDVPGDLCATCGHADGRHTSGGMCMGGVDGDECYCVHPSPLEDTKPVATQFYSPASLYCLTPCTEEVARGVAARLRPQPVTEWDLPRPALAPAPSIPVGDLFEPEDDPEPPEPGDCECGHTAANHVWNTDTGERGVCCIPGCDCSQYDETLPF